MNKYFAEGIGTFSLVFAGCGAIIVNDLYGGALGHVGISLVFGLIVMATIYSIGDISGAHINPAVTLAFYWAGRITKKQAFFYGVSQFLGAIVASGSLKILFSEPNNLGITQPGSVAMQSFGLEVVMSFLLMFVILNVSMDHKEKGMIAGVAIGGVIALESLFGGPISGASMNPARSLGPAILSGNLSNLWIYLIAPFIGTLLAVPVWRLIQGGERPRAKENPQKENS
jgi:MIP family channel proteins